VLIKDCVRAVVPFLILLELAPDTCFGVNGVLVEKLGDGAIENVRLLVGVKRPFNSDD